MFSKKKKKKKKKKKHDKNVLYPFEIIVSKFSENILECLFLTYQIQEHPNIYPLTFKLALMPLNQVDGWFSNAWSHTQTSNQRQPQRWNNAEIRLDSKVDWRLI